LELEFLVRKENKRLEKKKKEIKKKKNIKGID
jgi:hypothetical protein